MQKHSTYRTNVEGAATAVIVTAVAALSVLGGWWVVVVCLVFTLVRMAVALCLKMRDA